MRIAFFSENYTEGGSLQDPFRKELMREFLRYSSEFLYLQTSDFMDQSARFRSPADRATVLRTLEAFKPQLVFSLNRAGLVPEVVAALPGARFSWFIDNPGRFPSALMDITPEDTVFCAQKSQFEWLAAHVPATRAPRYLPFCSQSSIFFRAKERPLPTCDASFVGTLWDPVGFMGVVQKTLNSDADSEIFRALFADYVADDDFNIAWAMENRLGVKLPSDHLTSVFDDFLSTQKRLAVLDALSDLRLEIYGTRSWPAQIILRAPELLPHFRFRRIESPEALVDLYRRSRTCISIAHHQAQTGFPIRVYDILGCGTPLVTDRHEELFELFEEGKMFLAYDSPGEARECILRVLSDRALAETMSREGAREISERHTFSARVAALFDGVTALRKKPLSRLCIASKSFMSSALVSAGEVTGAQLQQVS